MTQNEYEKAQVFDCEFITELYWWLQDSDWTSEQEATVNFFIRELDKAKWLSNLVDKKNIKTLDKKYGI